MYFFCFPPRYRVPSAANHVNGRTDTFGMPAVPARLQAQAHAQPSSTLRVQQKTRVRLHLLQLRGEAQIHFAGTRQGQSQRGFR